MVEGTQYTIQTSVDSKLWSINVVQSIKNEHVTKRVQGGCKLLEKNLIACRKQLNLCKGMIGPILWYLGHFNTHSSNNSVILKKSFQQMEYS
jgi:hypothetical protein